MPKRKKTPPAETPGPEVVPNVPEDGGAAPSDAPHAPEGAADASIVAPYVPANVKEKARNGSDAEHDEDTTEAPIVAPYVPSFFKNNGTRDGSDAAPGAPEPVEPGLTEHANGHDPSSTEPHMVVPYIGGGGGFLWYEMSQTGDFVDFVDNSIFADTLVSSGAAPSFGAS